jgi:hypothetical protein
MLGVLLLSACSPARTAMPTSVPFPLVTPVPNPLPTTVYRQPSSLAKIIDQVFGDKNRLLNPGQILADGQKVAESVHFEFYMKKSFTPVDLAWWQQQAAANL